MLFLDKIFARAKSGTIDLSILESEVIRVVCSNLSGEQSEILSDQTVSGGYVGLIKRG